MDFHHVTISPFSRSRGPNIGEEAEMGVTKSLLAQKKQLDAAGRTVPCKDTQVLLTGMMSAAALSKHKKQSHS